MEPPSVKKNRPPRRAAGNDAGGIAGFVPSAETQCEHLWAILVDGREITNRSGRLFHRIVSEFPNEIECYVML
jgi:hypothetical protein